MSERQRLVDQLVLHEGLRLKVYLDSVGIETIGVGRNLRDKGISNAEAMMLLDHDIDEVITDLSGFPWFPTLDPVRQRAISDMRFNLGPNRFRGFKRMLRMLSEQNYPLAAAAARESKWYGQVKMRGVRIVHMLLTGEE